MVDRLFHLDGPAVPGTSSPARAVSSYGGVARNVAENLSRLGVDAALVTCVGDDAAGLGLVAHAQGAGIDTAGVRTVPGAGTAEYAAVLDPGGDLVLGVAAMEVLARIDVGDLTAALEEGAAAWVLLDCNLAPDVLAGCLDVARAAGARVAVDAVSTAKVTRLPADLTGVEVLFLNRDEARALVAARGTDAVPAGEDAVPAGTDAVLAAAVHGLGPESVVLTRGAEPALVVTATGVEPVAIVGAPAVVDVTGAGDAFLGGTLAALVAGDDLTAACRRGARVALLTVGSEHSVRPDLSPEDLLP